MLLSTTFLLAKPPFFTPTTFLHSTSKPRLSPPHLRALNTNDTNSGSNQDASQSSPTPSPRQTVQIRIRRGARKRARQLQQQQQDMNSSTTSSSLSGNRPSPPKDWDSMTIGEKAVELYMGEKGLLFWLNKFAYASIFVIVGGWILFRFVGPSLGLYQLDSSPLPPSTMFKSSS